MNYLGQAQEDIEQVEAATPEAATPLTLEEIAVRIDKLQITAERDLFFRKIATGAAIAGALFAAVRLTDIWLAVKRRRAGGLDQA
jgi:hypothetical protein